MTVKLTPDLARKEKAALQSLRYSLLSHVSPEEGPTVLLCILCYNYLISRRAPRVPDHKATVPEDSRALQQPSCPRAHVGHTSTPSFSQGAASWEMRCFDTGSYQMDTRREGQSTLLVVVEE